MISIKDFTIMQTIIGVITAILAASVIIAVLSIYNIITITNKELFYDQASEINKQIVFNYENYTSRVEAITNLLQKKIIEDNVAGNKDQLADLFLTTEELENSIVSIALFTDSGDVIASTRPVKSTNKDVALKVWYKNAVFDQQIIHFTSPHLQNIYETDMGEVISASKLVSYKEGNIHKLGVLLIDIDFEGLDSLSKFTNLGKDGHIIIFDSDDHIVYATDRDKYNEKSKSYEIIKEQIFGSTNATIDGVEMVIKINTISATRWRIATFQDINAIEQGMNSAMATVVGLVIISIIVTILVAYFVAKQITNPLKKLNKAIIKIHSGNYDSKVVVQGQKEITTVTTAFNEMIDKIQQLMKAVVREQKGKRKTEIRALQNQINPHFLYNTLDCIIWLAEKERNEDLVETVSALSTYFRVSLSKGKQFIPIHEELKHIESYMLIQKMRYNDIFSYTIECKETIGHLRIMKLILQPIVENAIYHGIDKDDINSYIKIEVTEEKAYVVLSVINSGYGISEKKINDIQHMMVHGVEKGSVGMKNVYRRLKLYYGVDANLIIESDLDEKTTISIRILKERLEGGQLLIGDEQ